MGNQQMIRLCECIAVLTFCYVLAHLVTSFAHSNELLENVIISRDGVKLDYLHWSASTKLVEEILGRLIISYC